MSGRLEQRSWEDKNSGQRRSRTEVVVEDFTFMGGNGGNGGNGGGGNSASSSKSTSSEDDYSSDVVPDDVPDDQINLDEIPF